MKKIFAFLLLSACSLFSAELKLDYSNQIEFDREVAAYKGERDEVTSLVMIAHHPYSFIDNSSLSQFSQVKEVAYKVEGWVFSHENQFRSLATLPHFPSLEKIDLSNAGLTNRNDHTRNYMGDYLNLLSHFSNLRSIDLSYNTGLLCPNHESYDFSVLSNLEHLEELNISETTNRSAYQVKEGYFKGLETLSHLKTLRMRGVVCDPVNYAFLQTLPLEELDTTNDYVLPSCQGIKRLTCNYLQDFDFISQVPALEELTILTPYWISWDFRQFDKLSNLRKLHIEGLWLQAPHHYEQIEMVKMPFLEELAFPGGGVKKFSFSTFSPNLRKLNLHGANVTNGDAAEIAKLQFLEELDLGNTSMNGTMVKKLVHVKKLNLSHLDLTNADFSGLQNLEWLDVSDTMLSLKAYATLKELKNLKYLNMSGQQNPNIQH